MGAVSLGFEEQAICPTKGFLSGDPLNYLWLSTDDTLDKESLEKIQDSVPSGSYLLVDGTVSCADKGFGDLYGGAIKAITLIVVNDSGRVLWSIDPRRPMRGAAMVPSAAPAVVPPAR